MLQGGNRPVKLGSYQVDEAGSLSFVWRMGRTNLPCYKPYAGVAGFLFGVSIVSGSAESAGIAATGWPLSRR